MPHKCNKRCLGPLTFHPKAKGEKVCLSQGDRLAERISSTFGNGIVFSSRPVQVMERICLRVLKDVSSWHGAIRLGFTTVPPSTRTLPLPSFAIPNLTDKPGHWAAPVDSSHCEAGSELEFWVSHSGEVYVKTETTVIKVLKRVDVNRPLWAMVDVYGQTCAVVLLGSEKCGVFSSRRSCPAPESFTLPYIENFSSVTAESPLTDDDDCISCINMGSSEDKNCVVCMVKGARVTLPCGHRCLCKHCAIRVQLEFGTCPLCRHIISDA
ncbi:E3 ubiquitin-protein ligase NEURL3-like [Pholidichthys leucotaenia]